VFVRRQAEQQKLKDNPPNQTLPTTMPRLDRRHLLGVGLAAALLPTAGRAAANPAKARRM